VIEGVPNALRPKELTVKPLMIACLLSVTFAGFAWAQDRPGGTVRLIPDDGPSAPTYIACSYTATGSFTEADGSNPGEKPGKPVKAGAGWRQVMQIPDGRGCPRQIQP
jgi:hypothetical protein